MEINVQQEIYDKKNYLKTVETSIKDFFKDKIGENNQPGRYDMYKLYFLQEKSIFSKLSVKSVKYFEKTR